MGKQIKVGDRVDFKRDVEGHGIVAKITSERNWMTGQMQHEYAIKSESEPNGCPFHREATFCYDKDVYAMVVWVDEDHIWPEE